MTKIRTTIVSILLLATSLAALILFAEPSAAHDVPEGGYVKCGPVVSQAAECYFPIY